MAHIRTRLRFALLKATLVAVRGIRGRCVKGRRDILIEEETPIGQIPFNLIPQSHGED